MPETFITAREAAIHSSIIKKDAPERALDIIYSQHKSFFNVLADKIERACEFVETSIEYDEVIDYLLSEADDDILDSLDAAHENISRLVINQSPERADKDYVAEQLCKLIFFRVNKLIEPVIFYLKAQGYVVEHTNFIKPEMDIPISKLTISWDHIVK